MRLQTGRKSGWRRFLSLLLILILLLPSVSAEEETAVRVGQIEYPLSLARYMLESYVYLAEVSGDSLTEEEMAEAVEKVRGRKRPASTSRPGSRSIRIPWPMTPP